MSSTTHRLTIKLYTMKNTILFDSYDSFMKEEKLDLSYRLNPDNELVPEFFRDFKYPISSWPIILPERLTDELERVSIRIPQLLNKVPELYFKNDAKRIADFFFQGDELIAQFFIMCVQKETSVSCRLDLTYTTDGFKVLEANIGSAIGGLEFQHFEPLMEHTHNELNGTKGFEYKTRQTQNYYMKLIVDEIGEVGDQVNVFLVGKEDADETWKEIERKFYNNLLTDELAGSNKKGDVFIDTIESLKFKNNALYYNDTVIHSVLILDTGLKKMTPDLFRALLMDTVYFPDHLGNMFIGDKRCLGLLRHLAEDKAFSQEDNELILRNVPWTEIVEDAAVVYKGKSQALLPMLQQDKDGFVVKVADGMQGNDVYIGKYLTQEEWEEAIAKAVAHGKYIAQEFSDSMDLLAPDDTNQWSPHKLIWGSFGFGNSYGGVWVRMSALKNTSGVINSAKGAVEAIVYESHPKAIVQQAKAQVLTI